MSRHIKTVLLGGNETGKTSFMRTFLDISLDEEYKSTTFVDFLTHVFITTPETETWQIWDGSTTDPLAFLMQDPSMAFLFVDLTRIEDSIAALAEKNDSINENTRCAIIFSKSDLVDSSIYSHDEIKKHTEQVKQAMALSSQQIDTEVDFYITTTTKKATVTKAFESNENVFVSTESDEEDGIEPTAEAVSAPTFDLNFDYVNGKMRTLFPEASNKNHEQAPASIKAPPIEYQF